MFTQQVESLTERAAWDYIKTKEAFMDTDFGEQPKYCIVITDTWSTSTQHGQMAKGRDSILEGFFVPSYHIDVDDTAKLHILALTRQDRENLST